MRRRVPAAQAAAAIRTERIVRKIVRPDAIVWEGEAPAEPIQPAHRGRRMVISRRNGRKLTLFRPADYTESVILRN
jgi:hypothetical protein